MNTIKYIILGFLTACGISKSAVSVESLEAIELRFFYKEPYCGGANKGNKLELVLFPLSDKKYYYGPSESGKEECDTFRLDSNGSVVLELEADVEYAFYREEKMMDFDQFKNSMTSKNKNFKNKSDECYEDWWKRSDAVYLTVKDGKIIQADSIIIPIDCYVRDHPCIEFTGLRYR